MAAKREDLEIDGAASLSRPIALITDNGFSIVRTGEDQRPAVNASSSFVFIVTDPENVEREVTVTIAAQATREIRLRSRGRIGDDSSYWICCAERHLADYLWENEGFPPQGRLEVGQLTCDGLSLARRWYKNA